MTPLESAILDSLRRLEDAASRRESVLPVLREIDTLLRQLPPGSDPDLLHYLHKRSYEKARLHLEGLDPEQGACPR